MSTVEKIQHSANQIWLAGLGAFSNAQDEGIKVFDSLVKQGQQFENKTSTSIRVQLKEVEKQTEKFKEKANDSYEKFESQVEKQVRIVLSKLGIPTQDDLNDLRDEVKELREALDKKKRR